MCQCTGRLLRRSLFVLPIFTFFWTLTGLVLPYGVAIASNHTYKVFPYISNSGILVPERGVFTLFISIAAFLMLANALVRYQYIKMCLEKSRQSVLFRKLVNINKTGLFLSALASFGLFMAASFQVKIMDAPHYLGAFLTFISATIVCWLQSYLTLKKDERENIRTLPKMDKWTFIAQLAVSILTTSFLIIFSCAIAAYKLRKKAGHGSKTDTLKGVFLLSSISEWCLAISVIALFLTFAPGFKKMEFIGVNIKFKENYKPDDSNPC